MQVKLFKAGTLDDLEIVMNQFFQDIEKDVRDTKRYPKQFPELHIHSTQQFTIGEMDKGTFQLANGQQQVRYTFCLIVFYTWL